MKNKIIILSGTIILTIILFTVSTYAQRKLIDCEPKIKCLFIVKDITENQKIEEDMFETKEIDVSLVARTKIIQDYSEIENLYAKDNLYKGQLAISKQFDTKENLSIYEIETGKEKTSIKIKSAENGISYSIKKNSKINVYVTLRADLANKFLDDKEKITIGNLEDGYTVIKLLENITVLDLFDIDGNKIEESDMKIVDTIMIAVTPEEIKLINLLRDICIFNISGIGEV